MSFSPSAPFLRPQLFGLLAAILIASPGPLHAQDSALPEEHFSVEEPANLSPDDAESIYARVIGDMTSAYALSRDPSAESYQRWRRFNTAPYPSATHGSRYVNNYGNGLAGSYDQLETFEPLPEGAVLAKTLSLDSAGD